MEEITNSVNTESISEATVNAGSVENATETVKNADLEGNSNTETAENTVNTQQQTTDNATADRFDDGEKFAKAFSKRLNKEKEKLNKEYEPFKKVVGLAAKQFGMSEEDYIKSILEDYGDEAETKPTQRDERDILIEELLNEKREKGSGSLFKEIMAENFPTPGRNMDIFLKVPQTGSTKRRLYRDTL